MTKVLFLIRKRSDLTSEEFRRYWSETHAPIAATMPGLRKYTQNHAVPDPTQGDLALDGIAELSFDSPAAFQAALASPEGQATLGDVPNFLDADSVQVVIAEEVTIL
jgi:uncharacterized protein (TIGR02118 family)